MEDLVCNQGGIVTPDGQCSHKNCVGYQYPSHCGVVYAGDHETGTWCDPQVARQRGYEFLRRCLKSASDISGGRRRGDVIVVEALVGKVQEFSLLI